MPARLSLSGINLGVLMAAGDDPKVSMRDVGESSVAVDGSMRTTRNARKIDTAFKSVPVSVQDAHSWRCLISGEGEVWNFDSSLYGSKGSGPTASTNVAQSAGSAKYGAGKLSVGATTGTVTYGGAAANSWGKFSDWTVSVWRFESGAWHHYVVRSDGAKWLDGVRADATSTTWLTVSSGNVTIANSTGSAVLYDDLVVLPFKVLDDWPTQIFDAVATFGESPALPLTGELVTEQSSRMVLGMAKSSSVMRVATGLRVTLDVELEAR